MPETALFLEITRRFEAPPERVFDAWLSRAWGEWIGPANVRGEIISLEPKVGGQYRIVMHSQTNADIAVGGIYREIDRPRRLVFTWKWENGTDETIVTLTFKAAGNGTLMTMRHEGFSTAERRDSHNNGWTGTFDKLETHLAQEKT
jgi:uncharacterized protein YndB with AHSA1/START domain